MNSNKSFARFVIVATFTIFSTTSALAAEPDALLQAKAMPAAPTLRPLEMTSPTDAVMTAESATAKAQFYQRQADTYLSFGGVGYKAGLVQRAEANAAKYAVIAAELAAPSVDQRMRSPEAERFARLAAQYRLFGGVAYKAGLVQWAEAQERKYEPALVSAAPMAAAVNLSCRSSKPIACFLARTN